jgi:hypothetical protein
MCARQILPAAARVFASYDKTTVRLTKAAARK